MYFPYHVLFFSHLALSPLFVLLLNSIQIFNKNVQSKQQFFPITFSPKIAKCNVEVCRVGRKSASI